METVYIVMAIDPQSDTRESFVLSIHRTKEGADNKVIKKANDLDLFIIEEQVED